VKLIYDAIEEVTSSRFDVTFEGTGEFMDEEDMRAKYAAKPKRLDAILRNAKRIWDSTGEVELLEDMKYTSAKKATESHETKRKRSIDTEEKPKKQRQPKVKVEKKDDGEAAGEVADVKTLSEKQVAQIKAWKEQIELLQKTFEPITEQLSGTDDWLKHLPAWVTQKVQATQLHVGENMALMEVAIDSGKLSGELKKMKDDVTKIKNEIKDVVRRTQLQIDEAQKVD
jgi:hypothetical protein